jgi:hypothetical protein
MKPLARPHGELATLLLRGTLIGDLWLVADDDALAEQADIAESGLPVFFFDEVDLLRGKTPEQVRAIAMIKAAFPTGRVRQ